MQTDEDRRIEARARELLEVEVQPGLAGLELECNGGVLRLSGRALTESARRLAESHAKSVASVVAVVNELVVPLEEGIDSPSAPPTASSEERAPEGWHENFRDPRAQFRPRTGRERTDS